MENPNDKLFRALFGDPESAAGFLRKVIPISISEACDWDQLQLLPGTWVDSDMQDLECDCLYRVPLSGAPLHLYLLFEHQSKADQWMALRLLVYMTRIWQGIRRESPTGPYELPPILPLVLYQGASPWSGSTDFQQLVAAGPHAAEMAPFTPIFVYHVFDLARTKPEEIPGPEHVRATLHIMQSVYRRTDEFLKALESESEVMDSMLVEGRRRDLFEYLIRYLFGANVKADPRQIAEAVASGRNNRLRGNVMTIAERLIQEGRVEGLEEGRGEGLALGLRRALVRFLSVRFGAESNRLHATLDAITNSQQLEDITARAYAADSLAAVEQAIADVTGGRP